MTSSPPSLSSNAGSPSTRPNKPARQIRRPRQSSSRSYPHLATPIPTLREARCDPPNPVAPTFSKILQNSAKVPFSTPESVQRLFGNKCAQNLVRDRENRTRQGTHFRVRELG